MAVWLEHPSQQVVREKKLFFMCISKRGSLNPPRGEKEKRQYKRGSAGGRNKRVNYGRTDRWGSSRELWFHPGRQQNTFGGNLHFKLARYPACRARNLLIRTLPPLSDFISTSIFPDLGQAFTVWLSYHFFHFSFFMCQFSHLYCIFVFSSTVLTLGAFILNSCRNWTSLWVIFLVPNLSSCVVKFGMRRN